jgi:hypothetical protein
MAGVSQAVVRLLLLTATGSAASISPEYVELFTSHARITLPAALNDPHSADFILLVNVSVLWRL